MLIFESLETKYPLHIPLESQLVDYKPQKYFEVIIENILILPCALSTWSCKSKSIFPRYFLTAITLS